MERLWGSDGFVPYDVFGLAAAFALFSHGWLEAERFASLAIRSGHAHDAPQVKTVELEYMNCLAKRFLFADSKLHFPNATEPKSDLSSVSMSVQN